MENTWATLAAGCHSEYLRTHCPGAGDEEKTHTVLVDPTMRNMACCAEAVVLAHDFVTWECTWHTPDITTKDDEKGKE